MRTWILWAAVAIACLAWTQGPDVPRLGWLLDDSAALRPLNGLAANFVAGETLLNGVISFGSSGDWTVAKTAHDLILLDRNGDESARIAAPGGKALYAFAPGGEPAAVYFAETGGVLLWSGDRFGAAGWTQRRDEEVLSLARRESGVISFLVQRGESVWQVDRAASGGQVIREQLLAGASAPALMRSDGSILFRDGTALVLRTPDSGQQRMDLAGTPLALGEMGCGWTSVRLADRQLAVSFFGGQPRVFEIPGGGR